MSKRILIASPVFDGMEYCFMDFLFRVNNVEIPEGYTADTLIVDNSSTTDFIEKYKNMKGFSKIKFYHQEKISDEKPMEKLIRSRNYIVDYAKDNDYDYLFMLDSDVMLPFDILVKLLGRDKDAISGLYFGLWKLSDYVKTKEEDKNKVVALPVAYRFLTDSEFLEYKKKHPNVEDKMDVRIHLTEKDIKSKELFEVSMPSPGCFLLSRKAFTSGARYGLSQNHNDDQKLMRGLRDNGFKIYVDTSCICQHSVFGKYGSNNGKHPLLK